LTWCSCPASSPTWSLYWDAAGGHGRYLAEHIPGAAFVELDGDEHIFTAPVARQILAHVIPFVGEAAAREAPEPAIVSALARP
jgi:hypothetical protein